MSDEIINNEVNIPIEENTNVISPALKEDTKWVVLRVVSGKERSIKQHLDKDILKQGWQSIITNVFLPTEKVYKVQKNANKKTYREKNFFPGYLFLEVVSGKMSDDMVLHITNINNIMHFLTDGKGAKGRIIHLRKEEVDRMLGKVDERNTPGSYTVMEPLIIGETIKIIEGPFSDFNGVIEEMNEEKKRLKVSVKIFGRSTPVELTFGQVTKL